MSDLEVVRACAESNDPAAWREFVARFQRPIRLSLIRISTRWGQIPDKVVEDLTQETYLKVCADKCRLLLQFAVQHPESVTGYVKVIAVNLAHDYFKSANSQRRGSGQIHEPFELCDQPSGDNSLGGQGAIERQILVKQIDEYLGTCSAGPDRERDRVIFWLHYRQGMSAKAIAALPTIGLTTKGVESLILRLTRSVREQMIQPKRPINEEIADDGKDFVPQNRI
jgi:RNA polymerase sigma-70 factor, ECF subfamily